MDVSYSDLMIYFVYIYAKTSCVWTSHAFRLTIEHLRIKLPCKPVTGRPEREPPRLCSSKYATALLRSLCKVLK